METKHSSTQLEITSGGHAAASSEDMASPLRERMQALSRFFRNGKVGIGSAILLFFIAIALLAPVITPGDPINFVGRPHQPPSSEYWLGTTGQGQDVFAQLIWGARISLGNGYATGFLVTVIATVVGLTAAYFGGRVDDVLSLFTNVVLIIPSLPLLVVLASFLPPGPKTILLVLTALSWPWGARVLRSQALSLREKDFVSAALVSGENNRRIIFREILPNMTSLVVANFIGATVYTILAEASLEFLGLGNVSTVTWGTILFWASNNAGMLVGAWWTFVPAGLCISLVAFALAMINYGVDEITNPRLRSEKELERVLKKLPFRTQRATPVVRDSQRPSA